ncbi:MAG: GGDEF domain-containing protein [Butyrivibrio sp.]|nr:GGDEF domain-containing protein [Butyrivibrio sp.]MBR1641762.1 GGDEF domain-containing protein [Butyrivibrio sp.]
MIYSMVPAVVLIINLILNEESLVKYGILEKKQGESTLVHVRYNHFVIAACCYFFVDGSWGILYEHHDIPQLFPVIYFFTVFYFVLMLFTMLTWTRYIVAYLDKHGMRTKVLLYGVWTMVVIGVVCLMLNRFFGHFMFSYNEAHEYIGESGRNISFILQIAFYAVITVYMLSVASKSTGQEKLRYNAVAATSVVLGVFQILQITYAFLPFYAMGLMVGICLVFSFVQSGEKKEKEIHDNIANAMAQDYEAIFYIEIETGEFISFSKSQKYLTLNATELGKDFFKEALDCIDTCVYPDDREYAKSFFHKEEMLKRLEGRHSFSFKYRVMFDGIPRFFLFTVSRDINERYLIFYEKDIDDELNAEKIQKDNQKKTVTFGQIAESLASNYDEIYYVNVEDSAYAGYEVNNIYGQLEISKSGEDFFKESLENIPQVIHRQDMDQVSEFITKDNLLSMLEEHKDCSIDYRIMVNGKSRYTRMIARKSSDGTHLIIGVEDIDEVIKREKRHMKALKTEKELARRDELTGVRNKTAYKELEKSIQSNIDNGMDYLNFALVVCDSNNLKMINDTLGHAAGDEYIKASAQILCDIFVHSPVFRVGGDEFVVFLRGSDFSSRKELMEKLRSKVIENQKNGDGVALASGMAEYQPETDSFVSEVFDRADKEMYADKQSLKA